MTNNLEHNLQYFEASSMKKLYDLLCVWQEQNETRFYSVNIQNDNGLFSCIALSNPVEVLIKSGSDRLHVSVTDGEMWIRQCG